MHLVTFVALFQVSAWIALIVLVCIAFIEGVLICAYCYQRSSREPEGYHQLQAEPMIASTDLEDDDVEKE